MSEPITTEEIQALRALCSDGCRVWVPGDIDTFRAAVPRLLDEVEHERQTVDTLRDNICVMTVESLDDKDEIQRLKELARELADELGATVQALSDIQDADGLTLTNGEAYFAGKALLARPDVAELREE